MTTSSLLNTQVEIKIQVKCLGNLNKRCYNNTVHLSPLLVTILSIAVQSFVGVIFQGLIHLGGYLTVPSLFLWWACPLAVAVHSGFLASLCFFVVFNGGYEATPLWTARVPLLVGGSILHQGGRQALLFLLTWRYLPISLPPLCLALPTITQFGEWLHSSVRFTTCQHQWALTSFPPPYVCVLSEVCSHIMLPKVFTHLLWMLWWTSMAEVITSCLSTPGKLCW